MDHAVDVANHAGGWLSFRQCGSFSYLGSYPLAQVYMVTK